MDCDTIAAIATAPGPAGVSIVRISGPDAHSIGERVSRTTPDAGKLTAHYAFFRHPETDDVVDDGIILFFRAPNSYTGEDVVELQGHGGRLPSSRLLEIAILAGARPAEPGEFTRRAFLNGRIDLARAEAVMDFIGASSERAASSAREQLDGRLSKGIDSIFDAIVSVEADVEHLLDFDENEIPLDFEEKAVERCRDILSLIDKMLAGWRTGAFLREGALVVICGLPNAGKSSLLNALLGRNRAIVSPVAGTTRDSIEESLIIRGIPVRLVDTAGLRDTKDGIEAEGVSRAEELVSRADLVVEVVDASLGDMSGFKTAKDRITVFNKVDLLKDDFKNALDGICISAKNGDGLDIVLDEIANRLDDGADDGGQEGVSARHRSCLLEAKEAAENAVVALATGGEGLVVAANYLALAAQAVGRVTGRIWSEELLDVVFGKFCVGK